MSWIVMSQIFLLLRSSELRFELPLFLLADAIASESILTKMLLKNGSDDSYDLYLLRWPTKNRRDSNISITIALNQGFDLNLFHFTHAPVACHWVSCCFVPIRVCRTHRSRSLRLSLSSPFDVLLSLSSLLHAWPRAENAAGYS